MPCEECIKKREALLDQRKQVRAKAIEQADAGETVTLCKYPDGTYYIEQGIVKGVETIIGCIKP